VKFQSRIVLYTHFWLLFNWYNLRHGLSLQLGIFCSTILCKWYCMCNICHSILLHFTSRIVFTTLYVRVGWFGLSLQI